MPAFRKLGAAVAAAAVAAAVAASPAAARQFEGTVVAKNNQNRVFKLRQDEGGGTFRIKVRPSTTFEDIAGFGAIKVGARNIEVVANKKRNGRWIARHVERSGKSGGGGDNGSGDDN